MRVYKQISAFLVNKPGRLANICSALAKQKIDVMALTVMDTKEQGVLRLVTDDPTGTSKILTQLGAAHTLTDVVLVDMSHRPGALARVCEKLASEHIGIDYAYCSAGTPGGKALGVFKVSNISKATKVLGPLNGSPAAKKRKSGKIRRKMTASGRR